MRHRPVSLVLVLVVAVVGAGVPCRADLPTYHVTELGDMVEAAFPGVDFPSSHARGLNENGDLVGEAWLNGAMMGAFVYTVEHGVTKLPTPPGWPSAAVRDVSERDENGDILIVGGGVPSIFVDLTIGEAALWRFSTTTGHVIETRLLGVPAGFEDSIAVAVSNDGVVAGFSGLTGAFVNWAYDAGTQQMQTFDFPARITDMNNLGQVCGGVYRGDLFGNYEDLTETYEPGDVMPAWAIENGGISAAWHRLNDAGALVGRAPTGISDGAGHFLVAIVRYADDIGWTSMNVVSHLSLAGGVNGAGDFMDRTGGVYFEAFGDVYGLTSLLAPEFPTVFVSDSNEINDHRQVAGGQAHALLLTPLGEMIIPGDVNGDVQVDPDDFCAWVAAPIDLDGDRDVDGDDEQWLIDRLLVFGFVVTDCNGNGAADFCDIRDGVSADCDQNDIPDECQPDCNGDGVPDVCEPDCNDNGVPDPCDIDGGSSEDCNGNGVPDECDGGGVTEVALAYDPPVQMLVNDVITETVTVLDVGIIEDVNLTLDISYRLGDFTVLLTHGDVTITIMDQPGDPAFPGGFVNFGYDNAAVDDEGAGPFLENAGDSCCTFEALVSPPIYRPDMPLRRFDGEPSEGDWTLTVITTDHFSPGDGLLGWGLAITREATPVPPCCPADLDEDGVVSAADLAMLLAAWGAADDPADLDGDDAVDASDLAMLLAAWGPCD